MLGGCLQRDNRVLLAPVPDEDSTQGRPRCHECAAFRPTRRRQDFAVRQRRRFDDVFAEVVARAHDGHELDGIASRNCQLVGSRAPGDDAANFGRLRVVRLLPQLAQSFEAARFADAPKFDRPVARRRSDDVAGGVDGDAQDWRRVAFEESVLEGLAIDHFQGHVGRARADQVALQADVDGSHI